MQDGARGLAIAVREEVGDLQAQRGRFEHVAAVELGHRHASERMALAVGVGAGLLVEFE